METGIKGTPEKKYYTLASERCYRMKPDALPNHAPEEMGIYELVTFDEKQNPRVLYIGWAKEATVAQCLLEHLQGARNPKASDLIAKYGNLYFDFIFVQNPSSHEDWQDVAWVLMEEHKPPYNNSDQINHSGRYSKIELASLPPDSGFCASKT